MKDPIKNGISFGVYLTDFYWIVDLYSIKQKMIFFYTSFL